MSVKKLYWKVESLVHEMYAKYCIFPYLNLGKKHVLPKSLIVSLTSYKPRFAKLHLTVKTLLSQSIRPDKVILWIAEEEKHFVPSILHEYQVKFSWFEIRYCTNLRSYKKIIPSLIHFPDSFIVTCDDDIFYPKNWLLGLCDSWNGNYKQSVAYRTHLVKFSIDGHLKPYSTWLQNYRGNILQNDVLFPTGCGGVLYPPNVLHKEVLNQAIFLSLCPNADDVWLFWMLRLNSSEVIKTKKSINIVAWPGTDDNGLASENVQNHGNDSQIIKVQEKYGLIKNY